MQWKAAIINAHDTLPLLPVEMMYKIQTQVGKQDTDVNTMCEQGHRHSPRIKPGINTL